MTISGSVGVDDGRFVCVFVELDGGVCFGNTVEVPSVYSDL